jgi:hypothetical protein
MVFRHILIVIKIKIAPNPALPPTWQGAAKMVKIHFFICV